MEVDTAERETLCWWIANGASRTGVSPPGLATGRDGNRTKVSLLRPATQSGDEQRNSVDALSVCDARIPETCCVSALFV